MHLESLPRADSKWPRPPITKLTSGLPHTPTSYLNSTGSDTRASFRVLPIVSPKSRLIHYYLQRMSNSYDRSCETRTTAGTSSHRLLTLPQPYHNQKLSTKMDTDPKLYVSAESAAHYTPSLEVEQETRQKRKKGRRQQGCRRHFPNYNADKSLDQESFDKNVDNGMNNLNDRQNGIRNPAPAPLPTPNSVAQAHWKGFAGVMINWKRKSRR
jgi:hypothetical protein